MDNPGTSCAPVDTVQENVLTNKFLSGEMSFAEYSTQWYGVGDVEYVAEESKKTETEFQSFLQSSRKPRRGAMHLSAALLGLMGEANLRFVRGDKETAEKMCHELIKQVPTAPEPYQTLAQIYEHDEEKSLQFSLLAAHLSPPDVNEWLRLAAISKQRNDIKQELICYSQAIKAEPHNLSIHLKRLELVSAIEESKLLQGINLNHVKCYHKIVNSMPPTASDTIMKYARLAATTYHNNNEIDRALEVLSVAYKKCPSQFNLADTNIFLELLISRKQYQMCLEVFVANLGVDVEAEIQTVKNADGDIEEQTDYLNCCIPHDLPIDLKSKLLICFIHLGAHSLVQTLLCDFLANDVEKAGDLYMDIEEALSAVGEHELAIKILEPLVKNHSFDLGAVWLKHADCLYHLGREEDAIESYHRVLKHAPQHSDARWRLFSLHEKRGEIEKALNILQQDYKYVVSAGLLYEHCTILKKYNKYDEYLEVGEALLSKSFMKYRHPEEIKFAFQIKTNLIDVIHEFRISRGENPYDENALIFDEEEAFKLTTEQEWVLFKDLLQIACKHKKYDVMQRLSYGAMMSKPLLSSYRAQMEFFCLQASYLAKDYHNTFRLIKELTVKNPTPRSWNLLNLVLHYVDDVTPKFLNRLFQKDCQSYSVVKNLFLGNSFLSSGRYLVALKYFFEQHNQVRDPLSALLIGITMLVMAAQRTVDKHNNLILQGMCYLLKYQSLRKCNQETNFNLGRAYQMLSINNLAIEYYERALAAEPVLDCPEHGSLNLTKEAAFNLYLIYKDHSPLMARRYEYSMNMAAEVVVPANDIHFSDFCTLLEKLFALKKKEKKEQDKSLANFINDFRIKVANTTGKKSSSFFPVLRLLLPDKDRERAPYNLKETKLGALLVKVLSISKESNDGKKLITFRAAKAEESDFAGVAYYVFKNRMGKNSSSLTIGEINELLDKIATAEVGNKNPILDQAFSYALKNLTPVQMKWFLRILLKDLKLAMGTSRILAAFHPDAPDLYDTLQNLSKVCEELEDGETRPLELGLQMYFAVSPMLSERLDVTRAPLVLRADRQYFVENKFDGERFQLHMENGVFEYFSRKGFTYSENYGKSYDGDGLLTPLLKDCFSPVVNNVILDGEMMGWHKYQQCFGSKGMAFDVKKITTNSKFRPCYCVFDVLYLNGRSLAGPPEKGGLPLTKRLDILKTLFTDKEGVIMHSEYNAIQDIRSEVLVALNKAIDNQEEGIIVKDSESYYIPNKRNAGWYKIKPEYTGSVTSDLDVVIVGADEAANKRQGRARSFTVACADARPGEAPHRWLVIGKVSTGVTHEERERICALLEKQWVPWRKSLPPPQIAFHKEKADFWIKPEYSVVVQVRATELVRTSELETEYTLRFPRIVAIRDDKPVNDILKLDQLKALVAEKAPVVKLNKKRVSETQLEGVDIPRRKRTANVLKVASQFRPGAGCEVAVTSRALSGRALHVLSDDEDCSRAELVRIIESHSGKHHENIGVDTWCCVVGKPTYRARTFIQAQKVDAVSTAWLRALPPSETPCTLSPLDMISMKTETRRQLSRNYDRHRDSYTQEIDVDTLKKCFDKWEEPEIYLTIAEMLELDKELFGEHNPFSYLRPCFIHFTKANTLLELKAKMYGANVCQIDSPNLTHVVVKREDNIEEIKNNINIEAVVVLEEWLKMCFEKERLVPETAFVLQ